jgi:hypothetical protein
MHRAQASHRNSSIPACCSARLACDEAIAYFARFTAHENGVSHVSKTKEKV